MKKNIVLLLIIAMLLSCAACGVQGEQPAPGAGQSFVMPQNNIECEFIDYELNSSGWVNKQYFKINGLKNPEIQDSINKQIEDMFMQAVSWEEFPKYRGLMLELKKWEGVEPFSDTAMATRFCNVGNVLSVELDRQRNYEINGEEYSWLYIEDYECLNFDLNTGKQIKITDVFRDDVNGLEYIDDHINKIINNTNSDEEEAYYSDGWDAIKPVGEFPGITEDQKFYISSDGDYITLVFDDETPWVWLYGYYPTRITVDISKVSALGTKYVKDNIYSDDSRNYILLPNSFDESDLVYLEKTDEYGDMDYMGINRLSYNANVAYYKGMPESLINAEKQFLADSKQKIDKFVDEYGLPNADNPNFSGWITISANISRYGNYVTLAMNMYLSASEVDENWNYTDLYRDSCRKSMLFKEGEDAPLTAADIFIPEYDYREKLGIDDSFDLQLLNDSLFAAQGDDYRSWTYREIGCDNLTIFK